MAATADETSAMPVPGDVLEVEWPCQAEDNSHDQAVKHLWFRVEVLNVQSCPKPRFLLLFVDDGEQCWNSLRRLAWRRAAPGNASRLGSNASAEVGGGGAAGVTVAGMVVKAIAAPEVCDPTGFVHRFELDVELLGFCDELHERRECYGDKTRGDAAYGEPLHGGLVSVVIRREALPQHERELYNALHQRCIQEVPLAWPSWLRRAGGREARARPAQDLRLLQYSEGANFKAHVDSGWACQALVYLNEDFQGGHTEFPNLGASYKPRRGVVLMWRSVSVGHKPAVPGSLDDHPSLHVAGPVFGGVKRVVSIHLVLA